MNKQTKERLSHRFREVSGCQRGEEQEVERNRRGRLRCRLLVTRLPCRGGDWAVWGQQPRRLLCDRTQLAWRWRPSWHGQKPWSPLLRTSNYNVIRQWCFKNKLVERRIRLVVARGGGKGELDEGGQKLQNSRYREVRFKMINITNTVVHSKVVKGKSWVLMIGKKHVFVFL